MTATMTSNEFWFDMECITEVSLSATSATVGGHGSLTYVPGAKLLGALAARHYASLDVATAFRLFHSGEVGFGPAWPVDACGCACVPTPFSWHRKKESGVNEAASPPIDLARTDREDRVQYVQCRDGWVGTERVIWSPRLRGSLRTAVGTEGRAREGFLFGLTALPEGTRLTGHVRAGSAEDLAVVRAWFGDGLDLALGRSRSAEFGQIKVSLASGSRVGAGAPGSLDGSQISVLALSDIALRDEKTGAPTFTPAPEAFGLDPTWQLDASRSFLRVRVYSPFNTHRRRPDVERQVLQAGSVLTFKGTSKVNVEEVRLACLGGVGDYRAEGLGIIAVEPAIFAPGLRLQGGEDSRAPSWGSSHAVAESGPPPTSNGLFDWVAKQEVQRVADEAAWAAAMGRDGVEFFAPARIPSAQWGEIRQLSRRHRDLTHDVFSTLIEEHTVAPPISGPNDRRSLRHGDKRWGRSLRGKPAGVSLVAFAKSHGPKAVELLAIHVVRRQQRSGGAA